MKKIFFAALIAIVAAAGCNKDDNCNGDSLSTAIIGKWKVTVLGITAGDVEFKSDGTFVDDDSALFDDTVNGQPVTSQTYVVTSDSNIKLTVSNSTGSLDRDIHILDYDCNEINFEDSGIQAKMKKK